MRSQIYIRWHITDRKRIFHEGLIARYFGWNFGIRMVSRCKSIIEEIRDEFLPNAFFFSLHDYVNKLNRYCDVNFDMQDIQLSTDIINEVKEQFAENPEFLFQQDSNNGQLFIDVSDSGIKYGLMEYFDCDTVMDAEKYMEWDRRNSELPNWHIPDRNVGTSEILYTERNIEQINKMATIMSLDEIHQFVDWSLEYMQEVIEGVRVYDHG